MYTFSKYVGYSGRANSYINNVQFDSTPKIYTTYIAL